MLAGRRCAAMGRMASLLYGAERAEAASRGWKRPFVVRIAGCIRAVLVCSVRCLDSRAIPAGVRAAGTGRLAPVVMVDRSPASAPAPNNAMQRTREQAGRFWKAVSASR